MATSFSGGRSQSNLQSRARTHAILVIGLYELLGNPTHWATRAFIYYSICVRCVVLRPGLYITKRCTRLAAASDKVYLLLAHGRWVSPGTPGSSTTKTGCHDIEVIQLPNSLRHPCPFPNRMCTFLLIKNIKQHIFNSFFFFHLFSFEFLS
jgi:hypothetical protein